MSDDDGESVMRTRTRRANAGSRLSALIQTEQPLDDAENIFLELDDDEEFDVEKNNLLGDNLLSSDDETKKDGEDGSDAENSAFDSDMNASTTDDSDIEKDDEPEDAGEQELIKQQRAAAREKRKADQKKMFKIKVRTPKPPSQERKPRRELPPAEVVFESSRRRGHSSRETARKSKEHLLEQIRENEKRKAQYVAPKAVAKPKLTQEQRLEEAKITEAKNLASLNHFVELEEIRKQEHRLAMLKRRPKLSEFVRYTSATVFVYPMADSEDEQEVTAVTTTELVSVSEAKTEPSEGVGALAATESELSTEEPSKLKESAQELPETPQKDAPDSEITSTSPEHTSSAAGNDESHMDVDNTPNSLKDEPTLEANKSLTSRLESKQPESTQAASTPSSTQLESSQVNTPQPESSQPESAQPESVEPGSKASDSSEPEKALKTESAEAGSNHLEGSTNTAADTTTTEADAIKTEPGDSTIVKSETKPAKRKPKNTRQVQHQDDEEVNDRIAGPPAINNVDFVTIHEFPDYAYNKYAVRSIVLGKRASKVLQPPAKRICPFTGRIAKYLDPSSEVAYASFEANKMLKMAKTDQLEWSHELGGVYLGPVDQSKVRHASGVPEGFA